MHYHSFPFYLAALQDLTDKIDSLERELTAYEHELQEARRARTEERAAPAVTLQAAPARAGSGSKVLRPQAASSVVAQPSTASPAAGPVVVHVVPPAGMRSCKRLVCCVVHVMLCMLYNAHSALSIV